MLFRSGELLTDDAARERMARNGLRESATEYSWARCAADTRSVYERAIEDAAGA